MEVYSTMKTCKYCNKNGKFDRTSRRVLCHYHANVEHNIRHLWIAVAQLQYQTERYQG